MKLLRVEPISDEGNLKASVQIETPEGKVITCAIVKQAGYRAYLDTKGFAITHKQKRCIQREAVTRWADMISDSFEGLLESEKVWRGSRFKRLSIQLKAYCTACNLVTPTEHTQSPRGDYSNRCYCCGTFRKGRPHISRAEGERIEELKARQGTGGIYAEAKTL